MHVAVTTHSCVTMQLSTVNSCVSTDFAMIVYQLLLSNWQDGWTALMSAAHNGHKNVVDTLLHHGARVDLTLKVSAAESLQPRL